MSGQKTPEQVAAELVTVEDGHVTLHTPGGPPVNLCHHSNPALVREHAEQLRGFVVAVVRQFLSGRG